MIFMVEGQHFMLVFSWSHTVKEVFTNYLAYNSKIKRTHAMPRIGREKVVVLIPAHNEESSILNTIIAQLEQTRIADKIIVICDNCSDETYQLASQMPYVKTVKSRGNTHKKSGALNWAWNKYAQDADIVVCLDADTILPPNAIHDWIHEFSVNPTLGGSSSKFTMLGDKTIVRLQKAEFAKWTMTSMNRGWTSVLAGTGCAIRNDALKQIVAIDGREGPWSYESVVEDFELTYRVRELGYLCQVSQTVRAYTDAMKTPRSLWAQRMKWQTGTVEDLISLGINRLTILDWLQQFLGLNAALLRFTWLGLWIAALTPYFSVSHDLIWFLIPLIFIASDVIQIMIVPNRDRKDVMLAAMLIPQELFAWMRAGWFLASWREVIISKLTKQKKDRWSLQYAAEGSN